MAKNHGGPAFPVAGHERKAHFVYGMTLRDWYAGMAMQGMQSNPIYDNNSSSQLAQQAHVMADAMIKARDG